MRCFSFWLRRKEKESKSKRFNWNTFLSLFHNFVMIIPFLFKLNHYFLLFFSYWNMRISDNNSIFIILIQNHNINYHHKVELFQNSPLTPIYCFWSRTMIGKCLLCVNVNVAFILLPSEHFINLNALSMFDIEIA